MNIPVSDARALSLWEYDALIYHWNEAHGDGDAPTVPHEVSERLIDKLRANPELLRRTDPA